MTGAFLLSEKSVLRRELSAARDAISPVERASAGAAVYARLFAHPAFQAASVVCGYMSIRGELDLLPVWAEAVRCGKTYALPVTLTGTQEGQMIFRATPGFCPERLTPGRFGIAEPPAEADFPVLTPAALSGALILVPGLSFDADGYRIGYGGGYYDRFLNSLHKAAVPVHTVGLCFAACRRPRLPREVHDRAVETVIDERNPL